MRLSEEVHWIGPCYTEGDEHQHVSVFVLEGEAGHVLVDSGTYHHTDTLTEEIEAVTDGDVSALVLTHTDYPHSANVPTFMDHWDIPDLVSITNAPHREGLPDTLKATIGESLTVSDRTLHFVDPPLADRATTSWIFDERSGTLFTADGFGSYHRPDRCRAVWGDVDVSDDDLFEYYQDSLPWLKLTRRQEILDLVTDILDSFPVEYVAPTHGYPIGADRIDDYLEAFDRSLGRITSYTPA